MSKKRKSKTRPEPEFLNVDQAAEHFHCERSTVIRRIIDGTLPAIKMPGATGAYIIRRTDLPAELDKRRPGRKPRQRTGGDLAALAATGTEKDAANGKAEG